jgi:hypothetical protein
MADSGAAASSAVFCESLKPRHSVQMGPDGKLRICRGAGRCLGDFDGPAPPKLAYGKQITAGRFRCYSLRSGIKCVVIRSGKGFLINSAGVTRVG